MPSTYTTNTGIELPADGEQSGAWGDTVNLNMQIVDRAMNGVVTVTLSGASHTLSTSSGALSDGQFSVISFVGSLSETNTVTIAPNTAQKVYFVRNATTRPVVLVQGTGSSVSIAVGNSAVVYSDGSGTTASVVDITAEFPFSLEDFGVTASTAELNILDGVTASTAELNILDGVTATTANINEAGAFANTFTLPTTDGTDGQVMTTDGLGALTFEDAGGGGGGGDVVGPSSATDMHVAFFDGATGKLIKEANAGNQEMFMNTVCLFKTDLTGVQIISGVGPSLSPTGFWGSRSVFIGDKDTGPGYHVDDQTSVNGRQVGIGSFSLPYSVGSAIFCGNTAIGAFSGSNVSTGNNNTYLGFSAGSTGVGLRQTGDNNTFIGAETGSDSVFRLDQNLAANNRIIMGNASISNAYINVQWSVTSDVRDKTDFAPLTQGLDVVDAIETYTFKFDPRSKYYVYDDDRNIIEAPEPDGTNKSDQTFVGFKAQQVEEVLNAAGFPPDVIVDTENPDHYKMKETALIPLLVNAIKELKERVETLEANAP